MLCDAHCHPFDLAECFPSAEEERRRLGVLCAASATAPDEFEYCMELSRLAKENDAAPLLPCFAIHPQLPANVISQRRKDAKSYASSANSSLLSAPQRLCESHFEESLELLETLAVQGRLAAVGETGFDLYNAAFRETEKLQDKLFTAHLETALRHDLPLVIHARRAMHKIFSNTPALKKCRSVIFHSWPGTAGEGEALIRRGINAFFSFGTTIMLNHREAMRCCAVFPSERLLTETDAPFQPLRGREYSAYGDIAQITETMALLRREAGTKGSAAGEIESIVEANFCAAFGI